jgi:hypothetical protein
MPSPLVFSCSVKLFAASCSVHGPGSRLNLGLFVFYSSVQAVGYYDFFSGSLGKLRIM